ncbi:MAG: DUF4115 domain-containing protein [Bacteroidetes bacterium]|nr:DUF4115 domain-containing protein [Bacteroidota bacterium]
MKEFGLYLKSAREQAGLTLEDLHTRTRISMKNLRLIESGDFPSIPQTYVRAFVREYARSIGIDEDATLTAYNEAAEREKGIPRPPAAIDSSNLLPKVDDTVEFVGPSTRSSSHVEIEGTAEVEAEDFVPPVRKSTYIRDEDAGAIDIRTSDAQHTDPGKPRAGGTPPDTAQKNAPAAEERNADISGSATVVPPRGIDSARAGSPTPSTGHSGASEERPPSKSATGTPPPPPPSRATQGEQVTPDATTPPQRQPTPGVNDDGSDKRVVGIGLVVFLLIAVSVYGLFYFGSDQENDVVQVDSTSIKASIEAGRFIDSTQAAMTELEMMPADTLPEVPSVPPEPATGHQRVFAREDSLVLEAFTNTPVWFSVKMDTLRTERGSLSSNEHRVWKARDFFVITLGDAGAVTFFLNGKEIGTLGEEGAVVKNMTLSRKQLNDN